MSDDSNLPPGVKLPNPVAAAQWASVGRHALTAGGSALAAFGISMPTWLSSLTDPQLNIIVSAVMFFGGLIMFAVGVLRARLDKWRARRKEVAGAVASAELGVPVTVAVTPPGQQNIAVKVSMAEANAAPAVPLDVAPIPAPRPSA